MNMPTTLASFFSELPARRYFFTRHLHNKLFRPLPSQIFLPITKWRPFHSDHLKIQHSQPSKNEPKSPIIDIVHPLKVNFADSMYRVIIHDNGLEYMFTPERYITMAIPTIKKQFALQIIQNVRIYKNAIVITAPLNDAQFYMKKLQRYSFTVTLVEA